MATGMLMISDPIDEIVERFGFVELQITLAHGQSAAAFPMLHKDPFDRIVVAHASSEQMVLVTVDDKLASYGARVL